MDHSEVHNVSVCKGDSSVRLTNEESQQNCHETDNSNKEAVNGCDSVTPQCEVIVSSVESNIHDCHRLKMTHCEDDVCRTHCKDDVCQEIGSCDHTSVLQDELVKVKQQLQNKEQECIKLTQLQDQTGIEVEELTASLFEEANKMVQDAHIKRMAVEKLLLEANAKVEILQAELAALKTLVITSTPSTPNPHLNPQIDRAKKMDFAKGHRRSTSHHNFVRDFTSPATSVAVALVKQPALPNSSQMEPPHMALFRLWKSEPSFSATSPFLACIISDDIQPCLNFANEMLSKMVFDAIFNNTIAVEPILTYTSINNNLCALTNIPCLCHYCVKLGDSQTPYAISHPARNRIIAVCDLITYMRYISQGLVKSDESGMYWEIARLRKKMCLARLGLEM